jgi:hypothetical protein
VGLTQDQEILHLLGLAAAAHQVWVWVSPRLHLLMEATAVVRLCITGLTTEVAEEGQRVLLVHMVHQARVEVAELHRQHLAATGLLVPPLPRHRQAQQIRAAEEVVARTLRVDTLEQRVVQAS